MASAVGARGCIWLHEDITLERQTQQRARLALVDPLTELIQPPRPVRGRCICRHRRRRPLPVRACRCCSSIWTTSSMPTIMAGHRAGDQILVAVAQAPCPGCCNRASMVAARMGGDEFAVIAPGSDAEQAGQPGNARLVQSISALRFDRDEHCGSGSVAVHRRGVVSAPTPAECRPAGGVRRPGHGSGQGRRQERLLRVPGRRSAVSQAESDRVRMERPHPRRLAGPAAGAAFPAGAPGVGPGHRLLRGAGAHGGRGRCIPADSADRLRAACRAQRQDPPDRPLGVPGLHRQAGSRARPAVCIAANLSARSLEDPSFVEFLREALAAQCDVEPRAIAHRADRDRGHGRPARGAAHDRGACAAWAARCTWTTSAAASARSCPPQAAGGRRHQDRRQLHPRPDVGPGQPAGGRLAGEDRAQPEQDDGGRMRGGRRHAGRACAHWAWTMCRVFISGVRRASWPSAARATTCRW
jgi:hypothetical protein